VEIHPEKLKPEINPNSAVRLAAKTRKGRKNRFTFQFSDFSIFLSTDERGFLLSQFLIFNK